jgi:hypothetical protein
MLSAREADLDAKIFQLILDDIRGGLFEADEQDRRIEIGDIAACAKAASFFPSMIGRLTSSPPSSRSLSPRM